MGINWNEVLTTVVSGALLAIIGAALAIFVTQNASVRSQKRLGARERGIAAAAELYRVYGAFFATWKAWESRPRKQGIFNRSRLVEGEIPDQKELLLRSAIAEGDLEALLLRITVEYKLSLNQRAALWAMRRSFKSLRYAIEEGRDLEWWRDDAHGVRGQAGYRSYQAFKGLAAFISHMLLDETRTVFASKEDRLKTLLQVVGPGREFFNDRTFAAQVETELAHAKHLHAGRKLSYHEETAARWLAIAETVLRDPAAAET